LTTAGLTLGFVGSGFGTGVGGLTSLCYLAYLLVGLMFPGISSPPQWKY